MKNLHHCSKRVQHEKVNRLDSSKTDFFFRENGKKNIDSKIRTFFLKELTLKISVLCFEYNMLGTHSQTADISKQGTT